MNLKKPSIYIPLLALVVFVIYLVWPSTATESYVTATARLAPFNNKVVSTGELLAENSEKIMGPEGLQRYRIYDIKINDIIPEGTIVKPGDYIATLDRSELTNRINDTQLDLEKAESQYTQIKLDTALTLRDARDQIKNLEYQYEQSKLTLEQSKYEPPATIKQAEMTVAKSKRAVEEGKEKRVINGREYLLELPLTADFALIKAHKADMLGNLVYRGTARAFNPVMAMAANITIVEVDKVVQPGDLDPEAIVTPHPFVSRIVEVPK